MLASTLCALALLTASPAAEGGLKLRHDPLITLDVHEADLPHVIRMLAEKARVNVVLGDDVKGLVTLRLRNVRVTEALGALLRLKGLGTEQIGSILRVAPLAQLRTEAEERGRLQEAAALNKPLKTTFIPVNYARAQDLAPLVQSTLTPRGKVSVDARTNTLIVTDVQ